MSELSQGTQINGRYTLQEYKGSGSFGEVWLAHDNIVDADVALKIYVSLNPAGISQFTEEYKTTANLSHPNLLTAKHFDVWERRPFLEMKYCGQGSADKLIGTITEKHLWHFIHDVAAGLHYLHDLPEPIIHQDIKPDNVLMDDDGMFLITDFGISKQLRATIRKQSGRSDASGSCAYMGPERFNADPTPIKASDIWSLGASIYELAKGELPFYGQGGVMLKNGADLPELGDGWSTELNQTIQACLAKDPWDRPTAEQLEKYAESMLQSLEAGRPVADAPWIKSKKTEPIIIPSTGNATVPIGKQGGANEGTNPTTSNTNTSNNKWLWILLVIPLLVLGVWGIIHSINHKKALAEKGYIEVTGMNFRESEYKSYSNNLYKSDLNSGNLIVKVIYNALTNDLEWQTFLLTIVDDNGKQLSKQGNIRFSYNNHSKEIKLPVTSFKKGGYNCKLVYNGRVISQYKFNVLEKPATYLKVTPPSRNVKAANGKVAFYVESDASWNISNVPDWCSIKNKAKNSFDIEYSENTSSNSRTAQITISSETGNMSKQVEIIQKGKNIQTVSYSNSSSYKEVVSGYENGHAYVDLGLPSGTLWATCNIGANRPEEYGNYYAWGETSTKRNYCWDTYKYGSSKSNDNFESTQFQTILTKYCTDKEYSPSGYYDNKKVLELLDDAAYAYWRGHWRMPTKTDFMELYAYCRKEEAIMGTIKGCKLVSKMNGNSIFLPFSGFYSNSAFYWGGSEGYYWSSSLYDYNSQYAWYCSVSSSLNMCGPTRLGRCHGYSVRAVCVLSAKNNKH